MSEEFVARMGKIFAVWMERCQAERARGWDVYGEGVVVWKNGTMAMVCREVGTERRLWRLELLAGADEVLVLA